MKLFEDQEWLLAQISDVFRKNKRVIVQSPTGSGKTVMIGEICLRTIQKGNSVCILVHREEIMMQMFNTLQRFGIQAELIMPGRTPFPNRPVYIGMVETFNRRLGKGIVDHIDVNFFINDEAHWGAYPKVIEAIDHKILGFTATPKSSGAPELNQLYDEIVCGYSVSQLEAMGRLVPGITFSVKHDFDKVKKKGKDFEERALLEEFKQAKLYDGAVKKYQEICPDRKAMCFNVNVQHSLDIAMQFKDIGVKNLYHIDGENGYKLYGDRMLELHRKELFHQFNQDEHAVLCNVAVATTGTDIPSVSCIIENYASMSITKCHQVRGRGARTFNGKKDFIIIDMGRNWLRHKRHGQDIDWKEIFHQPCKADPKEKTTKRDQRECEGCSMVIPMRAKQCPYCDMLFSEDEIENFLLDGATMEEIKQHKIDTLPIHLRVPFSEMSLDMMREYGKHMGWKPSAANIRFHKIQELKQKKKEQRRW